MPNRAKLNKEDNLEIWSLAIDKIREKTKATNSDNVSISFFYKKCRITATRKTSYGGALSDFEIVIDGGTSNEDN